MSTSLSAEIITSLHPCSIESLHSIQLHKKNRILSQVQPKRSNEPTDSTTNEEAQKTLSRGSDIEDDNPNIITLSVFLCGMYELTDASEQQRKGRISKYAFLDQTSINEDSKDTNMPKILEIDHVECDGGILDLRVCRWKAQAKRDAFEGRGIELNAVHSEGEAGEGLLSDSAFQEESSDTRSLLAASLSNGKIHIYECSSRYHDADVFLSHSQAQESVVNESTSKVSQSKDGFKLLSVVKDDDDSSLYLSVDWNRREETHILPSKLCVSTQNSNILVFDIAINDIAISSLSFKVSEAHTLLGEAMPVWVAIFDPYNTNRILSGGDDLAYRIWDMLVSNETAVHTDKKTHQAGVTTAAWHPSMPNIFATGSYDEHVRIWDDRQLKCPLREIHTEGGVWRLKWMNFKDKNYIYTASMQRGCAIFQAEWSGDSLSDDVRIFHRDEKYSNLLAYGVSLMSDESQPDTFHRTFASSSFYDDVIQIWNVNNSLIGG